MKPEDMQEDVTPLLDKVYENIDVIVENYK